MSERDTSSTQRLEAVFTKLRQIRDKAKAERQLQFTSLAHLMTVDMLRHSLGCLRKDAAPGVDGVSWQAYQSAGEVHLTDLHKRLREGRYRAEPVRRVHIEKEDGSTRPLGIPTIEDKIVQRAVVTILEPIYETDFYPCSFGFRSGRSAWQALDELRTQLTFGKVNYIIDADIKGYFDAVVQRHLMDFMRVRVSDRNILRLISKWLRAGVIDEGRLLQSDRGTPQGSVISPLLANIYLHYVLDDWWHTEVVPRLRGTSFLIRYADDFVMGFNSRRDAERVMVALEKRFERYGLELHKDKTRLIPYGAFAEERERKAGRNGSSESFNFLGFTHLCVRSHTGKMVHHVRTMAKRVQRTLKDIGEWCRLHRHRDLTFQWGTLVAKLRGHYNYYGRRTNLFQLRTVHRAVHRLWRKWLNRRGSQRGLTWAAYDLLLRRFPLPPPRITEPGRSYAHAHPRSH